MAIDTSSVWPASAPEPQKLIKTMNEIAHRWENVDLPKFDPNGVNNGPTIHERLSIEVNEFLNGKVPNKENLTLMRVQMFIV